MNNWRISTRIALAFGTVIMLSIGALSIGINLIGEIGNSLSRAGTAMPDAASLTENISAVRTFMIGSVVLTIMAGTGFSIWLVASIAGPLAEALLIAETVKSGDLSQEFSSERGGEFGRLLQGLGDMEDKLTDVVTRIRDASASIMVASEQISAGNEHLAVRTEQQALFLRKTVDATAELTSRVKHNAHAAQQAHLLATSASNLAGKGGEVVGELTGTMEAIRSHSEKIADIIGVIDGIAFQTNILALNAAVEAARAGENGRGFAVVASEVRTLAQRASTAAREINDVIGESAAKVEEGTARVQHAGETIEAIVESTNSVAQFIAAISTASAEQTSEIEQVNESLAHIDEVTHHNAALVEEAAAATVALKDQAGGLNIVVGSFRL